MKNLKLISFLILLGVFVITVLAGLSLKNLRFDYEFEDYFPKYDNEYGYYNRFRETFGSDNDFVLISIVNSRGIFRSDFLQQIDLLSQKLRQVPGVERVVSPTRLGYPVYTPFGMISANWIHPNQPERLYQDSIRIFESGELLGMLIATDAKSVTIMVTTEYGLSKAKSDLVAANIDSVLAQFSFEGIQTAGRIFGQRYYVSKMQYELVFFTLISLFIVIVFLLVAFRSLWGVVVPLIVVVVSVVWLLSLMAVLGKPFDLMSTLLPTIMFVVGISDVVHILSRYLEELRNTTDKYIALLTSVKHIGKATFLTSLTTAIGFLTLLTSDITPVRQFGVFTAIGVMIAYSVTFLVLPAILYLMPKPKIARVNNGNLFWDVIMRKIFRFTVTRPVTVLTIGSIVVAMAFIGISRVEVNNFLLEDLGPNDPLRANFEFFEKHYSGARPFEAVITTTNSTSLLKRETIEALDSIEIVLKNHFQMKGFVSITSVVKNLNRAFHGGKLAEYQVPSNQKEWEKVENELTRLHKMGKLSSILNVGGNATRLSAQVPDFGGKEFKRKYHESLTQTANLLASNHLDIRFTGMAYLIDKNNETLASGLMYGLLIAFGVVALIMGAIFKSVKMIAITFIPNLIPLLAIGGFMGLMGIDLKVSTSIIFTIAFGIAVDDTIHYMSKLKMELNKGRSMLYALKRTGISTGKAIVLTSMILVSGFFALIFSDFASTYYIGMLVSLTLLFAVIADLFLLPVLIILFYFEKRK